MPVDVIGGGGIWSLDARLGEDHALSKAAASHMHTPSTNICSRTLFTNTQTCEHTHRSQTLPHTYLTSLCLAEFSNYAELCTFEYAWSTAEEGTSSPAHHLCVPPPIWVLFLFSFFS